MHARLPHSLLERDRHQGCLRTFPRGIAAVFCVRCVVGACRIRLTRLRVRVMHARERATFATAAMPPSGRWHGAAKQREGWGVRALLHSMHCCTLYIHVAHRPSISQVPIDLVVEREASIIAAPKSRPTSTPFPRERLRVRASPRAKFSCFYLAKQIFAFPLCKASLTPPSIPLCPVLGPVPLSLPDGSAPRRVIMARAHTSASSSFFSAGKGARRALLQGC